MTETPAPFNQFLSSVKEKLGIFAKYPLVIDPGAMGMVYCTLGLTGESGEVADEMKKVLRDNQKLGTGLALSPERIHNLKLELGDVFWYWHRLIEELRLFTGDEGFSLQNIIEINEEKLRRKYGKGPGSKRRTSRSRRSLWKRPNNSKRGQTVTKPIEQGNGPPSSGPGRVSYARAARYPV